MLGLSCDADLPLWKSILAPTELQRLQLLWGKSLWHIVWLMPVSPAALKQPQQRQAITQSGFRDVRATGRSSRVNAQGLAGRFYWEQLNVQALPQWRLLTMAPLAPLLSAVTT